MVRFLQRIFGLTCQHVNGDKPYEKAGTFLALVLAAGRVGSGYLWGQNRITDAGAVLCATDRAATNQMTLPFKVENI